jgi:hypothetical protein
MARRQADICHAISDGQRGSPRSRPGQSDLKLGSSSTVATLASIPRQIQTDFALTGDIFVASRQTGGDKLFKIGRILANYFEKNGNSRQNKKDYWERPSFPAPGDSGPDRDLTVRSLCL